jgi:hypothetical protein
MVRKITLRKLPSELEDEKGIKKPPNFYPVVSNG